MKDVTATIENSVEKMNALINRLKNNDNKNGIVHVDIIHELRLLMNGFESSGRDPIPQFNLHDDSLYIEADKIRLSSVLSHIIQNAQEASNEDGEIQVIQTTNDSRIIIEIIDDGCGMSDEFIHNQLFQPFKTTKGDSGMGIGVFESREIIKELGGDILVTSTIGIGTKFTISLPMSKLMS